MHSSVDKALEKWPSYIRHRSEISTKFLEKKQFRDDIKDIFYQTFRTFIITQKFGKH